MLFNSIAFACFLPIVFSLYWLLPNKYRWPLLLVASYYFYMSWNPKFALLIICTTVISYFSAIIIEKTNSSRMKKVILIVALVICLGILFVFKYLAFFIDSAIDFLNLFTIHLTAPTIALVLPVGISFYTFQTLSYVIDVYRGNIKAEKNIGIYATFVSFFPQLVAGPIERSNNLLPQISAEHKFDYAKATQGMRLMCIGYYKKLVVADTVGQYVDLVYSDVYSYRGWDLIIAIIFFTIQIYCDFSGYSDIAIGTANLFGIDLMTNFKSPYYSVSVKEFWSRWHISLSTWFKDYVYIPLGGNRCTKVRRNINLLVTFLISGLWHGANWTFVIWGLLHGMTQIVENRFDYHLKRIRQNRWGRWVLTIAVFVFCNLAWVFFRANSISDAIYVISHVFCSNGNRNSYPGYNLGLRPGELIIIIITIVLLSIYDYFNCDGEGVLRVSKLKKTCRWALYIVCGLLIVFLSQKGVPTEFVYFQF